MGQEREQTRGRLAACRTERFNPEGDKRVCTTREEVPLSRIVEWLSTVAEAGVVEFVPKSDPMVQVLLRTRQDVYSGYTQAAFEEALREHFRITDVARLPNAGRILYLFCSK